MTHCSSALQMQTNMQKYDGTGHRKHRKPPVRTDCSSRRTFQLLVWRYYHRCHRFLPAVTKSFTQPFMQVAQQVQFHRHGSCRSRTRIFKLIDEEPEQDTGSVTLINAKKMRMERLLNAQNVPVCGHGKSLLTKMVL